MLRIVPLAHRGRVNWWLIVDRGAELSYILVVDLCHPLIEFGQHVSQRSGLADRIERHVPVRHYKHQSALRPQNPLELTKCCNWIRQVLDHVAGDYGV